MQRTTLLAYAAGVATTSSMFLMLGLGPGDDHGHEHESEIHKHEGHGHDGHSDGQAMSPEEEMAAYMATIMPGEQHAEMGKYIGTWNAKTSFIMTPGAAPVEGTGSMTCDWQLGGRYVRGQFHMDDMMGMPFDGLSYAGYDNNRQEYVSTWMDTFGTGILCLTGQKHEDGSQRMSGTAATPEGEYRMEIVTEWTDDDHFTDTFYDVAADGTRTETGRIVYTRR